MKQNIDPETAGMRGRRSRLRYNAVSALLMQLVSAISGFILSKRYIQCFGSEAKGLAGSASQFLSLTGLLGLGVGAVIQSSLYKPLADSDRGKIIEIIGAGKRYFRKLGYIVCGYIAAAIFIFPQITGTAVEWTYSVGLLLIMSISYLAQYFVCSTDDILLRADQREYIYNLFFMLASAVNIVVCLTMISRGTTLLRVELASALILLTPLLLCRFYNKRHYRIDRKSLRGNSRIENKWDGVAQHIAMIALDNTDMVSLSVFSLSNVSVYSVYYAVVNSIKLYISSLFNGFMPLMGEMWARNKLEELKQLFGQLEWFVHTCTAYIFTCVGVLIIPFVQIYTSGITDANYIQPVFAALLTVANAMYCLRLPYNMLILATGQYKQTQVSYVVMSVMKVVISVICVWLFGLVGVAIGSLAALLYQTVWMALYKSKHLFNEQTSVFWKQVAFDVLSAGVGAFVVRLFRFSADTYLNWFVIALKTVLIVGAVFVVLNLVFYRERTMNALHILKTKSKRTGNNVQEISERSA